MAPNSGPEHRYDYVLALFIRWEAPSAPTSEEAKEESRQLEAMQNQSRELKKLFKNVYKFETEDFNIPRERSFTALQGKLLQVHETYNGPRHLLIIYYAGHGNVDSNRNAIWCSSRNGSPKVTWTALQQIFLEEESELDVLMIIDCCKAGSSVRAPVSSSSTGNTVFVLASSGFDANAPLDGDTTYTKHLIATLADEETFREGRTVNFIATAVAARLNLFQLPSGARPATSVSYELREGRQPLKLKGQRRIVKWNTRLQRTEVPPVGSESDAAQDFPTTSEQPTVDLSGTTDQELRGPQDRGDGHRDIEPPPRHPKKVSPPGVSSAGTAMSEQDQELLARLAYPSMFWRVQSITHVENAFAWIFDNSQFRHWLDSPSESMIWISGKAGSGKSTLTSMLKTSSRITSRSRTTDTIMHMFWGAGDSLQKSIHGMLRSLLYQTLVQHPSLIHIANACLSTGSYDFTQEGLLRTMTAVLSAHALKNADGWLYIFLDGLDECENGDADLTHVISKLQASRVKICAASRPHAILQEYFRSTPSLRLEEFTRTDIEMFVKGKLRLMQSMAPHMGELSELSNYVVMRSAGVFLWVVLVMRSLQRGIMQYDDMSTLQRRVDSLPEGLAALYERILHELDRPQRRKTAFTFALLSAANVKVIAITGITYEPVLTTLPIWFAYGLERHPDLVLEPINPLIDSEMIWKLNNRMTQRLAAVTGGLVEVGPSESGRMDQGGLVSYIHMSARQFVEESEIVQLINRDLPPDFDANIFLLGSAVMQLKYLTRDASEIQDMQDTFLWSIVEQAMTCASRVPMTHQQRLVSYMDELDRIMILEMAKWSDTSTTYHWASLLPLSRLPHIDWHDNLLSLAIEHGIVPYVSAKISQQPNLVRKAGRPLLDYAIFPKSQSSQRYDDSRVDMVALLLRHDASLDDKFQGKRVLDRFNEEYHALLHSLNAEAVAEKTRFFIKIESIISDHTRKSAGLGRLKFW